MSSRDNLGLLLSLASAEGVARATRALRPLDLSVRSYTLLERVIDTGGMSQRALADDLRLDPSQIVALVDGLETRGLAERRPNPADRRQKAVAATARGKQTYRRAKVLVDASLDEVLGDLDPSERATLHEMLTRIVRRDPAAAEAAG